MKSSILDADMRPLPIAKDKILVQYDYDFCSCVWLKDEEYAKYFIFNADGTHIVHERTYNDWYIAVAVAKLDRIRENRHRITPDLLLRYRSAIREAYNHMLDDAIRNPYDEPRNRNTVEGVEGYIKRIFP
jgi:hypothetical protein